MGKQIKKIEEASDDLHFVLPIKLIPHVDASPVEVPVAEEDEKEDDTVKTEGEDVVDVDKVSEEDEEFEFKATESEDEEVKVENDETDEVKTESDEEEDKAPVTEEDDAEKKDDVVAEEDEEEKKLSEELGDLQLEQDVKDKIDAAFETIVKEKVARIREQLDADKEKQVEESVKKISEHVALYCEKVARSFIAQNRVALTESLRLKYFESFYGKMRKLFKENYIDFPESDENLAKELKAENDELKDKQDELLKDNKKLAESVIGLQRQAKIEKAASSMFLTESEKFKVASTKLLSEKLDDKKFDEKLKALAELFSKKDAGNSKKKLLSEGKVNKSPAPATGSATIHPDVEAIINGF